jgi:Lar family restriction alleviation protein
MTMLPCPFCGEEKYLEIGTMEEDQAGIPTYIYCEKCGAQGPWVPIDFDIEYCEISFIADITGWNKRL